MGNQHGSAQCLEQHYAHLLGKHMKFATADAKVGGTGASVVGGYSALEDYGNSVYSKAKEELIRGIAADVSSSLQVKSDYAQTAPIKDLIEKFKRIVPDPKNRKNIAANANVHKIICSNLAKAINKRYDMNIIDVDAEPGVVCQKVSEIMYSLFTGLHTEFLTVSGDVSRIIKNLQILKEYIDAAHGKIMHELASASGDRVSAEVENIRSLYNRLSEEINRQHAILANLTDSVIGPLGKSLVTLLADNNDFIGLTDDLKKMVGSVQFGQKLSYLLSGTGDIAHAAHLVDKALKEIGMSVKDYKNVKNLQDLREKVYNHMLGKKPTTSELHKLLVAADILYRNDMAHDDIASYLENKKGSIVGGDGAVGGDFADEVDDITYIDNNGSPFAGRTQAYRKSVGKQIREQDAYRREIFKTLNNQIKTKYSSITSSLREIARKIGNELVISPELELFIRNLNAFKKFQPDKQNIHIALSGFPKDISSEYVKSRYMEYLFILSDCLNDVIKVDNNMLFKSIKQEIDSLIRLIDDFNLNFTKTLSEVHINTEVKKRGGNIGGKKKKTRENNLGESDDEKEIENLEYSEAVEPSLEEEIEEKQETDEESETKEYVTGGSTELQIIAGGMPNEDFQHYVTMGRVINEIDYFYRIAGIKSGMKLSAESYDANVVNYENILGEEAGWIIDRIQKRYNDLIAGVSDNQPVGWSSVKTYVDDVFKGTDVAVSQYSNLSLSANITAATAGNAALHTRFKDEFVPGYKFLLEYIRSAKIEMIEAAQALDLYLSKFTKQIQLNPDQIKDFAKVVEQLEVVAKWFTDKSGDNFVNVFESFQNDTKAGGAVFQEIENYPDIKTGVGGLVDVDDRTRFKLTTGSRGANLSREYYDALVQGTAGTDHVQYSPGKFYRVRLMTRTQAINFVKEIEKSIKSVRALENIISLFSKINVGISDGVKTFMSSGAMFKAFMKYCVASVISVGVAAIQLAGANAYKFTATQMDTGGDAGHNANAAFAKMAVGLRFTDKVVPWVQNTGIALLDPLDINKVHERSLTDRIFEMCIKSMTSKVFVIVGSYSLFNKPAKLLENNSSMSNNALRQIMGGNIEGGKTYTKIIPDAVDLYIRLPLLVEWYRSVFDFAETASVGAMVQNADVGIFTIVPDMDGIFGPLCKAIFIDGKGVENGAYPSSVYVKIIESINDIYDGYKNKNKNISCREILNSFVSEINTRYGMMKRSEIKEYLDKRDKYLKDDNKYPDDDRVDFDILDSENSIGKNPAPSDRFRSLYNNPSLNRQEMQEFDNAVRKFRGAIEANLLLSDQNDEKNLHVYGNVSLSEMIRNIRKRVEEVEDDKDRYSIIHSQMHGIEKYGGLDKQKLILFHETVILPLTTLYFIYLIVNDFNKFMVSLNTKALDEIIGEEEKIFGHDDFNANGHNPAIYSAGTYNHAGFNGPAAAAALAMAPVPRNIAEDRFRTILALGILNRNNMRFKTDMFKLGAGLADNIESIHNVDFVKKYIIDNEYAHYLTNDDTKSFEDIVQAGGAYHANAPWEVKGYDIAATTVHTIPTGKRLAFNKNRLMEDLLRKVMNVGCDLNGLAEIYFTGSGKERYFGVNFDNLEKMCTELYTEAKGAMRLFKKYLPSRIINEYENVDVEGKAAEGKNIVSFYFIKEHLFERLFNNKYGNGLSDANAALGNIYSYLTKEYEINPASVAPATQWKYDSYNSVFSKLTFWNVMRNPVSNSMDKFGLRDLASSMTDVNSFPSKYIKIFKSGGSIGMPKTEADKIYSSSLVVGDGKIPMTASVGTLNDKVVTVLDVKGGGSPLNPHNVILGAHNLYDYNLGLSNETKLRSNAELGHNIAGTRMFENNQEELGLLVKLNQIIYSYVSLLTDKSNGKLYKPLLEKFINGHNSKDILQGKNINDKIIFNTNDEISTNDGLLRHSLTEIRNGTILFEPQQGAGLFASIANGIEGLYNAVIEKLTSTIPMYLEDNFANISEYQKELYKAYLPTFEKELNLIISRADFLKKVIENTSLKVYKHYNGGITDFRSLGKKDLDIDLRVDEILAQFYDTPVPVSFDLPAAGLNLATQEFKRANPVAVGDINQRARNGAILLSKNRTLGTVLNGVMVTQLHIEALKSYATRDCKIIMAECKINGPVNNIADVKEDNCRIGALKLYRDLVRYSIDQGNQDYKNDAFLSLDSVLDSKWEYKGPVPAGAHLQYEITALGLQNPLSVYALRAYIRSHWQECLTIAGAVGNVAAIPGLLPLVTSSVNAAVFRCLEQIRLLNDNKSANGGGAGSPDEIKDRGGLAWVGGWGIDNVDADALIPAAGQTALSISHYYLSARADVVANAPAAGHGRNAGAINAIDDALNEITFEAIKQYFRVMLSGTGKLDDVKTNNEVTTPKILGGIFSANGIGGAAPAPPNAFTFEFKDAAAMGSVYTQPTIRHFRRMAAAYRALGANPQAIHDNKANDAANIAAMGYINYIPEEKQYNESKSLDRLHRAGAAAGASETLYNDLFISLYRDKYRTNFRKTLQFFGNNFNQFSTKFTQSNKIPQIELESSRKSYLLGILNDITNTAGALGRCVSLVQKELSDVPLFMEQYQGSLTEYNSRNGHLPLIPLSSLTNLMNFNLFRQNITSKNISADETKFASADEADVGYLLQLIPTENNSGVGSTSFKWLYATRGLLNPNLKVEPEHIPGIMDIVDKFNSVTGGSNSFDKSSMSAVVRSLVPLMRYILDYTYFHQVMDKQDYSSVRRLMLEQQERLRAANANNRVRNLTCQTGKNKNYDPEGFWSKTENVLQLSENNNYAESVNRLMACITQDNKTGNNLPQDRIKMRIYNILDSNIVPINVHAMQREIPFSNLMNYSYTFDHLCKELIGQVYRVRPLYEIKGDSPIFPEGGTVFDEWKNYMHPEDTLVRSMIYPMGYRPLGEYINNVYRLMAGNTSLSLGRPKFLSDQLWNKVLCNNLFDNKLGDGNDDAFVASRDLNSARMLSTLRNITRRRDFTVNNGHNDTEPYTNAANAGINSPNKTPPDVAHSLLRELGHIDKNGVYTSRLAHNTSPIGINNIGYMGYLRYNSALIRWVEFFANVQRLLRMLMRHQLEWVQDPIVKGHDAISEELTEYTNNNIFRVEDFE